MVRFALNLRGFRLLPLCSALLSASIGAHGYYKSPETALVEFPAPGFQHLLADDGGVSRYVTDAKPLLLAEKQKDLSPEERKKLKKYKERFESLPPEERQRIRAAREKYKQMSPEEKETLRRKWENMSEEEKRQYKLNRGGN